MVPITICLVAVDVKAVLSILYVTSDNTNVIFVVIIKDFKILDVVFETILSWSCHVYGPFGVRTSLGTFILL